jgi:hypothetical protein
MIYQGIDRGSMEKYGSIPAVALLPSIMHLVSAETRREMA